MPKLQLLITVESEMAASNLIENMLDNTLAEGESLDQAVLMEDDGETIINDSMLPSKDEEGSDEEEAA